MLQIMLKVCGKCCKLKPDDYILATDETHSVREFVESGFNEVGITIDWEGKNENEIGINKQSGEQLYK